MSQNIIYTSLGGLRVESDTEYTKDNVPAEVTAIRVARGVRITDELGSKTSIRGLRVVVTVSGLTDAITPLPNVPVIMYEGEIYKFSSNGTYKFLDSGIIDYGEYTAV